MKRATQTAALLLVIAFLSGCAPRSLPSVSMSGTSASPAALPQATASANPTATLTPPATDTPAPTATAASTATPAPTAEPKLDYKYNPYLLPPDTSAFLGKDVKQYNRVVDAILARQKNIVLDNKKLIPKIVSAVYSDFPLSILLSDYNVDEKTRTLTFVYRYDAAEHKKRIAAFQARVIDIIQSAVKPQYNEFERILALYSFTASNIAYTNQEDVSPYNALMNGTGICQSYDGVLRFLLMQVGVSNVLSTSAFMTDGEAHVWSLVKIDGVWFHLDPTFESSTTKGLGLNYFGMDDARRVDSGTVKPFGTGTDDWFKSPAPACTDKRFEYFANAASWKLDSESHRLALLDAGGSEICSFDTAKLEVVP